MMENMGDYDNTETELPMGEKDYFKVLQTIFSEKELPFITDLSIKEIHSIAIILFLSDYLGLPEFESFIKNIMKLKVSKDRKGRLEFIDAFKPLKEKEDLKQKLKDSLMMG